MYVPYNHSSDDVICLFRVDAFVIHLIHINLIMTVYPIHLITWVCHRILQMDMCSNQANPIAFVCHVIHVNLAMAMQSFQSIELHGCSPSSGHVVYPIHLIAFVFHLIHLNVVMAMQPIQSIIHSIACMCHTVIQMTM